MGILSSVKRTAGVSDSQKAIKELDDDIMNFCRAVSRKEFSSEDEIRTEAEKLIRSDSAEYFTEEEAAFATVWGLSARMMDDVPYLNEPSEKALRYYDAALQAILELAQEYKTKSLAGNHRPHVIGYALYYLDIEVYQEANKHRKAWADEYHKAEEKGDKEAMQKYEELIEEKLKENIKKP